MSNNSITRRQAREIAFQILYQLDLRAAAQADRSLIEEEKKVVDLIQSHFEHFKTDDKSQEFIQKLVKGTVHHLEEIDQAIRPHLVKWTLERLPAVDRNILRLACFEMLWDRELAAPMVINEALEIGRRFGHKESPEFINAVLDRLHKGQSNS